MNNVICLKSWCKRNMLTAKTRKHALHYSAILKNFDLIARLDAVAQSVPKAK